MAYGMLRPALFLLDPERAHELTLKMIKGADKTHLLGFFGSSMDLPVFCMGMRLPNPVGLAAGLDKNGAYIDALANLGFGYLEVGTVTPKPQKGNDKPRLFRLNKSGAIINRMGFNNAGVDALVANVRRAKYQGVLGINIGKNAVTPTENALDDYVYCLERVYPHASYITINISSPNTKNLRTLQDGNALKRLLDGIKTCHSRLATDCGFYVPLALKIAPDLDDSQIDDIAKALIDFDIDGLIATNTTTARTGVEHLPQAAETGGLSGRPLHYPSTEVLQKFHDRLADKVDLIGVGGIDSGQAAVQKMQAGAKAVQLYSGLVYRGTRLVDESIISIGNYLDALSS